MTAPEDDVGGRYRLLQRIGAGGMGVVWRGYDERLGRDVAVKRLLGPPGAEGEEAEMASHRAMREARITARLHHPHAVPVFDVVEHEGQPCLVMEYFPSSSLADLAASGRALTVDEVARIGGEVASALAAAHRVGIVHRDVKPGNVLVGADGAAKISDFGISHAMGDVSLTSTGLVTGTPAYLAPEVARGEDATPASDVFSLGSTLYTALEGHPPFGTNPNPMAVLHAVASGRIDPPLRSGRLTDLLTAMLAARPQDRPSMDDVAHRLRDAATGDDPLSVFRDAGPAPAAGVASTPRTASLPVAADPEPDWAPAPAVDRDRNRWLRPLLVLLALAAAAGVVAALVLGQGDAPPDTAGSTRTPASSSSSAAPTRSASPSSTPAPSTTAASPSPSPTRPPTSTAGGAPTTAELRDALTGYYALLPGDRDAGWDRLTSRYQRTTATNRSVYEKFWSAIDKVSVADVKASAPETVTATVTYRYDDGRVYVERTRYRLVEDNGVLKIDRSEVLSSVQK